MARARARGGWGGWVAAGLVLGCAAAGCKKEPPRPVPVQGRVQSPDGTPVADRVLSFAPLDDENRNSTPQAVVGKDGTFRLKCVPGRYRVTMTKIPTGVGGPDRPGRPAIPERKEPNPFDQSRNRGAKPWEITIPEGGKRDLLLAVRQ
jgi:hypothetical protein